MSLGIIGEIDVALFPFFLSLALSTISFSIPHLFYFPPSTHTHTYIHTHFSINFVHCLRDDDDLLCTVFLFPSLNSQYIHVGVLSGKIVHAWMSLDAQSTHAFPHSHLPLDYLCTCKALFQIFRLSRIIHEEIYKKGVAMMMILNYLYQDFLLPFSLSVFSRDVIYYASVDVFMKNILFLLLSLYFHLFLLLILLIGRQCAKIVTRAYDFSYFLKNLLQFF